MKVGWVFFIFSVVAGLTCPTPGVPCMPRRCTPANSSAPGRLAHHRQQGRPRHAPTHTPGRWARCTGLHPILDRPRRADRTGGGCWRAGSVSGKVYNFGRLFLSIFIWIYFAESIDNPYIYGYNIISPDKYGLQPQYTKTGGQKP